MLAHSVCPPVCPQAKSWTGTISVLLLRFLSFLLQLSFLVASHMFRIAKPVIICSVMECPVISDPNFHWRIIVIVTKDNTI